MLLFRTTKLGMVGAAFVLIQLVSCHSSDKPMTNTSNDSRVATDPLSIHRRAIIVDMHADTTQRLVDENVNLQQQLADGHLDAVRAKAGGLDAQFFSIWVEPQLFGLGGERAIKRADDQIAAVRSMAEKHSDTWELA